MCVRFQVISIARTPGMLQQGDTSVSTPTAPDSMLAVMRNGDKYDVMDETTWHEATLHNNEGKNICTQT